MSKRSWAIAIALTCGLATACSSGNQPDWWRTNQVDGQIGSVRLVHVHIKAPPMDDQTPAGTFRCTSPCSTTATGSR